MAYKSMSEFSKTNPDAEWIDFQIEIGVLFYRDGFSDYMNGLESQQTATSYVSGYKDAKKMYKDVI